MFDSSSVFSGMFWWFSLLRFFGVCFVCDRLNIIWVVMYSWLFIVDSVVISIMKFIILVVLGRLIVCIIVMNGFWFCLVWF